jgi:uncharacterized membrane protein YphA (DoxX/SURF4 family)
VSASVGWLWRLTQTRAPGAVGLVRLAVAIVFVSEGVQKFLSPAALGAGRFAKIGIPAPQVMGPFIGVLEIVCGALILVGLLARPAALLLVADMTVAILSTKIPILTAATPCFAANAMSLARPRSPGDRLPWPSGLEPFGWRIAPPTRLENVQGPRPKRPR